MIREGMACLLKVFQLPSSKKEIRYIIIYLIEVC